MSPKPWFTRRRGGAETNLPSEAPRVFPAAIAARPRSGGMLDPFRLHSAHWIGKMAGQGRWVE
jgi:hypothetical protein